MSVVLPEAGGTGRGGRDDAERPFVGPQRMSSGSQGRISLRAVLVGIGLAAILAAVNPFVDFLAHDWHVGSGSLLQGPLVCLFLLLTLNSMLTAFAPSLVLSRRELIVVYAIGIVSVGLVRQGGIPYMVSATAYPLYFATPSNGWEQLIWPHIPSWLALRDPRAAVWFWTGLPGGAAIPLASWASPVIYWGLFTIGLIVAALSLGALLTPDWIEKQRLTFPLVDVPMQIVGDHRRPTLRSGILGSGIFWIGFLLASSVTTVQWLHRIYPSVPNPALEAFLGTYFVGKALPWSVLSEVAFSIRFAVVGVSFLIPANVSLSLWLFYLLYQAQLLAFAAAGITPAGGRTGLDPQLFVSYQEAGGFLALAAVLIYQSRDTLGAAWRSILCHRLSRTTGSRGALLAFIIANGVLLAWAIRAGSSWWSFLLLMGVYYAVTICAARLVAAAGVLYVDTRFTPWDIVLRTVGARALGPASLVMYSYYSVIFMSDPMNLPLPQVANSYKLLHEGRVSPRGFTWVAAVAAVAVIAVGTISLLAMVYQHGASSLGTWPLSDRAPRFFGSLDANLRTPEASDNWLRVAMGLGCAVTLALSWFHARYLWWPVSPFGFLLASSWCMNWLMWSSVMAGWAANRITNRYGGLQLFRRIRPAFIGLVLGEYLTTALVGIISYLVGIKGIGWA